MYGFDYELIHLLPISPKLVRTHMQTSSDLSTVISNVRQRSAPHTTSTTDVYRLSQDADPSVSSVRVLIFLVVSLPFALSVCTCMVGGCPGYCFTQMSRKIRNKFLFIIFLLFVYCCCCSYMITQTITFAGMKHIFVYCLQI